MNAAFFRTVVAALAGVVHGQATLGVVKQHFELFGGYDFLRIDSVNIQGSLLGVRFWF